MNNLEENYSLIVNKNLEKWIQENLKKYIFSEDKLKVHYKHKKFNLIHYKTTRNILIKGEIKEQIYNAFIDNSKEENIIGYDEVGVGDFFGPVVYCSVNLSNELLDYIKKIKINIKDSKKLKEDEILKIYKSCQKFTKEINYEIIFDKNVLDLNAVEQKVIFHNKNNLKYTDANHKQNIIDLFTTINSFYKYTKKHNLNWTENLLLETKADSKYLSVALASIMARGKFLEEIKFIEEKTKVKIPLGCQNNVIAVAREIKNKTNEEYLKSICKISFKTYNEV